MHECKTVTLRTRPLKGRMLSFYLDYYPGYRDKETMKVIRHETLGIYLYADPKNKREQNFNEVMTEKAEAIRCRRFESVVNERYDFFDKYKLKADFLEYFRSQLRKHDPKWEFVYLHFRNFVHGKCTFEEIDIDLCNKFREYLLTANKLKRKGRITRNSASGYWSTFRGLLKILYRNGLIKTNVNDFLDKIETEDVVKDYLSVDELYKLAETPCKKPVLKTASLFSCMTSLRISDILALCWEDIVDYSAGGKCVHIVTQKNRAEDIIPISEEALDLIGYSPDKRGMVFKGLQRCWTQTYMKEWIRSIARADFEQAEPRPAGRVDGVGQKGRGDALPLAVGHDGDIHDLGREGPRVDQHVLSDDPAVVAGGVARSAADVVGHRGFDLVGQ